MCEYIMRSLVIKDLMWYHACLQQALKTTIIDSATDANTI